MDLPDAQDKLAELKEQLEKPHGKLAGFFFFFFFLLFKLSLVVYWKIVEFFYNTKYIFS